MQSWRPGDTDEQTSRAKTQLLVGTKAGYGQATMSGQQIPAAWSERGYIPPEQLNIKDNEDDKGEAAYMRCFHESSKIGRVPNASYFVNSPTARAYVEKRDKELFPVKELSGEPIPNPDMPSWLNKKEGSKNQYPSVSEYVMPSGNGHLPPLSSKGTILPPSQELHPQPQQIQPPASGGSDQPHIPWSMEPRTGASGPPRMIR